MRDPKTHAKVLAKREHAIHLARLAAYRSGDSAREERLVDLLGRTQQELDDWHKRTGWSYVHWANPPYWRYVVLIPDTEEDTP